MPTINFPTIANNAPVVSRMGSDDTFVELSFRRLGEVVELVATRVKYEGVNGFPLRDELGREVVSEEDAGSVACDLAWVAKEALDETDDYRQPYPLGFEEAVLKELETDTKANRAYMVFAAQQNAAMLAAE
jgi:hypothetical protein